MATKRLKRFGNYIIPDGKTLGSGTFGVVYRATHIKTKLQVAMKMTKINREDPFQQKSLHREVYLLGNLKHPNIVRLFEAASSDKYFCIFMQLVRGITLLQDLQQKQKYSEDFTKNLARQIGDALDYLHRKRVIHRYVCIVCLKKFI